MTKTCSKCREIKSLESFYKQTALRSNDDGFDYYCKVCRNASAKKTWTTNKIKCTVVECDNPHYARTVCKNHYHKLLRENKKDSK